MAAEFFLTFKYSWSWHPSTAALYILYLYSHQDSYPRFSLAHFYCGKSSHGPTVVPILNATMPSIQRGTDATQRNGPIVAPFCTVFIGSHRRCFTVLPCNCTKHVLSTIHATVSVQTAFIKGEGTLTWRTTLLVPAARCETGAIYSNSVWVTIKVQNYFINNGILKRTDWL